MASPFGSVPYAGRAFEEGPSRITDLLLRAGDIQARRAAESGQIWGSTVAGLGQMAGGAIQEMQAQRAAQRQAAAERQQQAQVGEFLTEAQGQGFDLQSALGALPPEARAGALDLYNKLESARSEGAKRRAEAEKLQREAEESDRYQLAVGAASLKQALGTPMEGAAKSALLGYFREQYPDQVAQFESMPADQLGQMLDQLAGSSQKFQKELAEQAKTEAETQAKLAEPGLKEREAARREATEERTAAYQQQQLGLGYAQLAEARRGHDLAAGQGEGAPTLTPEAIEVAARRYLVDGTLPPMGMGKAGAVVRQTIINRAAEIDPQANIAFSKAAYGADVGSLKKLQQQTDAVTAFERTAEVNSKLLEDIAKNIPDFGSRFLNKPLRAASSQLGSTEMAKFDAIRQSVQNEYARILSNPNLVGTMSDSARKEAETILSADATPAQISAALKTLRTEAHTRRTEYQNQLDVIKGRLGGGGGAAPLQNQSEQPWSQVGAFRVRVKP